MIIGIIGAMEIEVIKLRDELKNKEEINKAGFTFYKGQIHGVDIILLQSGIGKVNAGIGAALLIDNFMPNFVINTGCAGGFISGLKVGDIVISKEVIHHDFDCTVFGYKHGQVPGMPPSFVANSKLIELADKSIHKLTNLTTKCGIIVTGDQFMNDSEATKRVKELIPEADAVEMEGAAIAQACHRFDVPFVVIRSISDIAGQENAIQYEEFVETAAVNSGNMVMEMIKELG